MPTSAAEQADLDKLHQDLAKAKDDFSGLCRMYLELENNPEQLKHTGHKSVEAALLAATKDHVKKLNNLAKAHVRKWPD